MWSNRWFFILAATGSAVGLGNLWKFPYVAGENGGGAFVLLYLACVFLIGVPLMMCEILMGREGRQSPINTLDKLIARAGAHRAWSAIAWSGVLAGFLILSFYTVIAGWAAYYILQLFSGNMTGATAQVSADTFNSFLGDPWMLSVFHTLFIAVTVFFVGRGVNRGLEVLVKWSMPLLFVLILMLLVYSIGQGGMGSAISYMFGFQWETLHVESILAAVGQAFFSLSLGMGALMAYGAYVPRKVNLGKTVITIALLDTLVAISAGLIIFSIVFSNGLDASEGPGLMFVTLPLAFGQMPAGALFGGIFFILVSIAALTSIVSLMEPALAWVVERYNAKRSRVTITIGVIAWILGLGTLLSFNVWKDVHIVGGLNFFATIDYLSSNIMLPLGGVFIALFVSWILPREIVTEQLRLPPSVFQAWLWLTRVVAPVAVLSVFLYKLLA